MATQNKAALVINTPSGPITSTDVQGALNELAGLSGGGGNAIPQRQNVLGVAEAVGQGMSSRTGMSSTLYMGNGTSQSVNTGVDMSTGDLGGLLWLKSRTQGAVGYVGNHFLFDSVRNSAQEYLLPDTTDAEASAGSAIVFTTTGFDNQAGVALNNSGDDFIAWSFQTNQKGSGLTNRGKAFTAHYNADMGFSIVGYEGDGVAGHEVPHFLGAEPELSIVKNRDIVSPWIIQGKDVGDRAAGDRLLFDTGAVAGYANLSSIVDAETVAYNTSITLNGASQNFISYHFRSIPGVSKVGKYIGTGAAGNYVECGFKAGFVLIKNLTNAGDWLALDQARGDGILTPNTSAVEAVADILDFTDTGFVLKDTGSTRNALNDEYLFLAFADSGDGPTDYKYPVSDDVLTVEEGALLAYAAGFNANGALNTLEEVPAATTVNLGAGFENQHLWLYKDAGGAYATTEFRPMEGVDRQGADKWGRENLVNSTLRNPDNHFGYESATGVALASGEDASNLAYEAFRSYPVGSAGTRWRIATTTTSWLQYKGSEKRILKSWRIRASADLDTVPRRFDIEGSNDGQNWTVIDGTYNAADFTDPGESAWSDIQLTEANTTAYLYHRINITANHGDATNTDIAEMEFNTIAPGDYYLVLDGKMQSYLGADLVVNGAAPTGLTGWTLSPTPPTVSGGEFVLDTVDATDRYIQQEVVTEVGKPYQLIFEKIEAAGAGADLRVRIGSTPGGTDILATVNLGDKPAGFYGFNFIATSASTSFRLSNTTTGPVASKVDNITLNPEGGDINRVYLAKIITGDNGEVLSLENLSHGKARGGDAEFQGDLTVHGEIKNPGAATAWVRFDGTINPPRINASYNVSDVIDFGAGHYRVVFEEPMDSLEYVVSNISSDYHSSVPTANRSVQGFEVRSFNSGHANADTDNLEIHVFGGKEIL